MVLLIIGDAQLAHLWDHLEAFLPSDFPFLNPNKNLEKVINSVDDEILIFNGDMVDSHFATYDGKGNNWDIFWKIVGGQELVGEKKLYLTRGNHDFRRLPYNLNLYGLNQVNVPKEVWKPLAQNIGYSGGRWLLGEWRTAFSNGIEEDSGLALFPPYYCEDIEGIKQIFLDTGPDAFNHLSNWLKPQWVTKMFTDPPYSRGLDSEQIDFLKDTLTDYNFIYMHAPPFFSPEEKSDLDVSNKWRYLQQLRHQYAFGIFISYNWDFVKTLREHQGNSVVITSHTEIPSQYLMDKKEGLVTLSSLEEVNEKLDDDQYVKFVSTFPLGAISDYCQEVGYLRFDQEFEYVVVGDYSE